MVRDYFVSVIGLDRRSSSADREASSILSACLVLDDSVEFSIGNLYYVEDSFMESVKLNKRISIWSISGCSLMTHDVFDGHIEEWGSPWCLEVFWVDSIRIIERPHSDTKMIE